MNSSKPNIISENQLTDHIDTRYVISHGAIPYIEEKTIDYEMNLPIQQTSLVESLTNEKRSHDLYFQCCIFEKRLKVDNYHGLLYFERCHFKSYVDFANTHFHNKVRFRQCTFEKEVYFNNTTFNDLSDFWRCKFKSRTIFFKTDFLGTAVFSGSTFHENVLFTYTLIAKLLILRGTNFRKGLDLSLANISGDISLFDIRLNDYQSVNDKPDTIEFDEAVGEDGIIYTTAKRETFRIIKHNFLTHNDSVSAQKYSLLESVTHRKEIWHGLTKRFNWRDLWDSILLNLNRASNNHKVSYMRGFAFTLLSGLIIFCFTALSTESYSLAFDFTSFDLDLAVAHFIQFITPTHDYDFIEENPPGLFYMFDFIGRILIAYGIYQTIQAFRKYR